MEEHRVRAETERWFRRLKVRNDWDLATHTAIEIERYQEIWGIQLEETQTGVFDGGCRWRTKILASLIPATADKKRYSGGGFK